MSESACQSLVDRIKGVPALPEVTRQMLALMDDPETSAGRLAQEIARDQALSARLLKIANSNLYGFRGQIDSIGRAIVLLGLNAVQSLALSISVGPLFTDEPGAGGFDPRELWRHCLTVGVAARRLSEHTGQGSPERCMLIGALHDVGLLFEHQVQPEELGRALDDFADAGGRLVDHERRRLDADHAELVYAVTTRWGFPETIRDALRRHHEPIEAFDDGCPYARIVAAAEAIVATRADGCCDAPSDPALADQWLERLSAADLDPNQLAADAAREVDAFTQALGA